MTEPTLNQTFIPRPETVLAKRVASERVLVDIEAGIYHGLNRVGAEIWERLDGERTLGQVVAELAERYPDVPRSELERDALALISELLTHGLVVAR